MEFTHAKLELPKKGTVVFLLDESLKLPSLLAKLDKHDKFISRALAVTNNFKGKQGQYTKIIAPQSAKVDKIILIGMGNPSAINEFTCQAAGGKVTGFLNMCLQESEASVIFETLPKWKIKADEVALHFAMGAKLKNYKFNQYFVKKADEHKTHLKKLTLAVNSTAKFNKAFSDMVKVTDGVYLTRNLVSMPPNELYPETFAEKCKALSKSGIKVTIYKAKDLKKMGMNTILAVAQGSIREAHLVVMEWNGDSKKSQPIAFVGKGVTFDSGGINIKPSPGMGDMKYDMGGAAVVTGLMQALATRKAKANVIGVVAFVENMPSGSASRPSDVVKSYSGQTIEIDNTDAEGRLILSDALWYTQEKYKPKAMINLATLTGAIVIALGENCYAGLFSNNDDLADKLTKTADKTNELLWRMPLKDFFDKQINSDIADVKNTGSGRGAGSITAAQFLQRFVNNTPWAHLDIAGMAWDKTGTDICPKGATGYGVRLLNQLVADYYEAK
jgi:leucyl aminopeptidase